MKKPLLLRVRRIKGQVEALERALENTENCGDILQQIAAVRGAVNGLMVQVIEGHIRDHLAVETRSIEERQGDLEQLLSILGRYLK